MRPPPRPTQGQTDSSPGTAGDPGGGGIRASSKEQVLSAIEQGLALFKVERFYGRKNVFLALHTALAEDENSEIRDILFTVHNQGQFKIQIEQSKIEYDLAQCPGIDEDKHAAVSDHKIGATICFNVEKLMELPPLQLQRAIYALIVHEYLHLLGHREEVAARIQELLVAHWERLEGELLPLIHFGPIRRYEEALNRFYQMIWVSVTGRTEEVGRFVGADLLSEISRASQDIIAVSANFLTPDEYIKEVTPLAEETRDLVKKYEPVIRKFSEQQQNLEEVKDAFCEFATNFILLRLKSPSKQLDEQMIAMSAGGLLQIHVREPVFTCPGELAKMIRFSLNSSMYDMTRRTKSTSSQAQ